MAMTVHTGPRGKYFTEVIRKSAVRATIRTVGATITGTVHVHPDERTLDMLNALDGFLAVTDAQVDDGQQPFEAAFLAVSSAHIVWVKPDDEGVSGHDRRD
jgi:hypothetical protein